MLIAMATILFVSTIDRYFLSTKFQSFKSHAKDILIKSNKQPKFRSLFPNLRKIVSLAV